MLIIFSFNNSKLNKKCWLIDFDKCGQKSGDSWKQGNLERLHRSFVKEVGRMNIQFNEENWAELLKGYNNLKRIRERQ